DVEIDPTHVARADPDRARTTDALGPAQPTRRLDSRGQEGRNRDEGGENERAAHRYPWRRRRPATSAPASSTSPGSPTPTAPMTERRCDSGSTSGESGRKTSPTGAACEPAAAGSSVNQATAFIARSRLPSRSR